MVTGKRLGAVAFLVATFAVGAVAGRATSRWGDRDHDRRPEGRQGQGGQDRQGGRFVNALQRELNLTPVQRDSVQAILKRYDPKMRAVWNGMRPTFDSLRAQVHADITQLLTDDQKAAFRRWSARQDSAARKRSKEEQGER